MKTNNHQRSTDDGRLNTLEYFRKSRLEVNVDDVNNMKRVRWTGG